MKKLLLLLVLMSSNISMAQEQGFTKPDYNGIRKAIQQPNTPLFYKRLMERFHEGDSSMTLQQKRHLYYGFIHQTHYRPYHRSEYGDSLRQAVKTIKELIPLQNKILKYTDAMLQENPFDLQAITYQMNLLDVLGKTQTLNKRRAQMHIIFDAIVSTGDGKSKETAYYVIFTAHEYALLSALGYDFGGLQRLTRPCDYLQLAENDEGITGLYFNIAPCLDHLRAMFKKD